MNKRIVIAPIMILVSAILLTAVSITGPSIGPIDERRPTTEDILICTWTPSIDTTSQTAAWYNGSTLYDAPQAIGIGVDRYELPALVAKKSEVWTCNVSVSNGTHNTWSSSAVTIKNALPSPPNATDMSLYEDISYVIPLNSIDPDGDVVTYHIEYEEGGILDFCSIHPNTGVVTCNPLQEHVGVYNVSFYVKDGGSYWPNTNVTYTIIEVNDPPYFNPALSDQTATEGILFNYTIQASDEEGHFPITFSIESNLSTISIHPYGEDGNQAYITFDHAGNSPRYQDGGYWYVDVNITDSGPTDNTIHDNATRVERFYLTVITVNQVPNITTNITELPSGAQNSAYSFTLRGNDTDEGDVLTFGIETFCPVDNPWLVTPVNTSHNNATGFVNVANVSNDHIACRLINITLSDTKDTGWVVVELNLTNVNDPPVIHEMSNNAGNTHGANMSNMSNVPINREMVYYVNASDPDMLTYTGDVLSYSTNTSFITINSETGRLNFTPDETHVGTLSVLINVSDSGLGGPVLWNTSVMTIHIVDNTAPIIDPLPVLQCQQHSPCNYQVTATDPDIDDELVFTDNSSFFTINSSTGNFSFIPDWMDYGLYNISITVNDSFNFMDTAVLTINISNTNDEPEFDEATISFGYYIMPGDVFVRRINVTDLDINLSVMRNITPPLDNLTYNFSFISSVGGLEENFSIVQEGIDYFVIRFTPNSSQVGEHVVNVTVNDSYGASDYRIITFEVDEQTDPPTIHHIRPFEVNNTEWANAIDYPFNNLNVSFYENRSIIFDANATNHTSDVFDGNNKLRYDWYMNDELVSSLEAVHPGVNSSFERFYDFFDEGNYTVRLVVSDLKYSNTWEWGLEIRDLNRPPELVTNFTNFNISATHSIAHYFTQVSDIHFYDPDDHQGTFNKSNNRLVFDVNFTDNCAIVNFVITDDELLVEPLQLGTCRVRFRATDPRGLSVISNDVFITVLEVPVQQEQVNTGSGGSSRSQPRIVPIPFEEPVETPHPISLIVPQAVTTYANQSVEVPIVLENKWNGTIYGIYLNATSSDETETHSIRFSQAEFDLLHEGENVTTNMYIDNYRLESPYSITINANVRDPKFVDSAVVFINAMERMETGDDVQSKVTFARDLLNDNPECHELIDLVNEAEKQRVLGNFNQAVRLVNVAVEGCKYLINNKVEPIDEQPKAFFGFSDYIERNRVASIMLGAIILVITGFGIFMIITGREKDDDI